MDKGNPKKANDEVTRGKEGTSHLSGWAKPVERGKKEGREKREEEKRREKLHLLSRFPKNPSVSVRWSMRQKSIPTARATCGY